jgi:hypothetical protein
MGGRLQYESLGPTYANATWEIERGIAVDLHALAAASGASLQSASTSQSSYAGEIGRNCDRIRLLEAADRVLIRAMAGASGVDADALALQRELNVRERQGLVSTIENYRQQIAYDHLSVNVSAQP